MIFIFFTNCSFEQFTINRNYLFLQKKRSLFSCVRDILLFFFFSAISSHSSNNFCDYGHKSKLHTLYKQQGEQCKIISTIISDIEFLIKIRKSSWKKSYVMRPMACSPLVLSILSINKKTI